MSDLDDLIAEMRQKRDELRVKLHLAGKDARDDWEQAVSEWDRFVEKAQLEKSADEVGEAARNLGLKLKEAFERARKSD
ncbi:hypothetical protein SAMN05444007_103450 [Cribrihabitans marinus]|uniref:Uncharacterized protein n=1 Tax=Cribrihabitans marinus TaxID=1227549 RepID=A0A1H6WFK8_9RHOB|nr:hypothetical protein [Cribrihabitans marinus]GGH24066.1 hypothetical protein GCM10010973_10360 [Cribrihabitans marinus]SEJ15809.1 hypothetical protein SAMN05444007_103450 [Cribrihabitans marinus]